MNTKRKRLFEGLLAGGVCFCWVAALAAEPVEVPITSGRTEVELTQGNEILVTVELLEMDLKVVGEDRRSVVIDIEKFQYDGYGHRKPIVYVDEDEKLVAVRIGPHVEGKRLTLTVPRQVSVKAQGQDGDAEVERIDGEVEIKTVDGDVALKELGGGVVASTIDGDVSIRMKDTEVKNPISLATVDGKVVVEAKATLDADLIASSIDGSLKTEIPIQINAEQSRSHWGGFNVRTQVGKGGVLLSLKTIDGDIIIREAKEE